MLTTNDDALFVDTNILVFLTNTASPWHADAVGAISEARSANRRLVISTQVVREYVAVGSREVSGMSGLPRPVVVANARAFRHSFDVFSESAGVLDELLSLVDSFNISG